MFSIVLISRNAGSYMSQEPRSRIYITVQLAGTRRKREVVIETAVRDKKVPFCPCLVLFC